MRRIVIIFNIVVGIVLILGFAFIGFTLFQRSKQNNQEAPVLARSLDLGSCVIAGTSTTKDRLFITLSGDGNCNRILILDANSLKEIGTITP